MEKEIVEFLNEVMDEPEVPRRLRLWALQLKTSAKPNKSSVIQQMKEELLKKFKNYNNHQLYDILDKYIEIENKS